MTVVSLPVVWAGMNQPLSDHAVGCQEPRLLVPDVAQFLRVGRVVELRPVRGQGRRHKRAAHRQEHQHPQGGPDRRTAARLRGGAAPRPRSARQGRARRLVAGDQQDVQRRQEVDGHRHLARRDAHVRRHPRQGQQSADGQNADHGEVNSVPPQQSPRNTVAAKCDIDQQPGDHGHVEGLAPGLADRKRECKNEGLGQDEERDSCLDWKRNGQPGPPPRR